MGKTNALSDVDMQDFITLQQIKAETEKSWSIKVADVQTHNYDLSVKNPNTPEEAPLRSPMDILTEMQSLDVETNDILLTIKELIG